MHARAALNAALVARFIAVLSRCGGHRHMTPQEPCKGVRGRSPNSAAALILSRPLRAPPAASPPREFVRRMRKKSLERHAARPAVCSGVHNSTDWEALSSDTIAAVGAAGGDGTNGNSIARWRTRRSDQAH